MSDISGDAVGIVVAMIVLLGAIGGAFAYLRHERRSVEKRLDESRQAREMFKNAVHVDAFTARTVRDKKLSVVVEIEWSAARGIDTTLELSRYRGAVDVQLPEPPGKDTELLEGLFGIARALELQQQKNRSADILFLEKNGRSIRYVDLDVEPGKTYTYVATLSCRGHDRVYQKVFAVRDVVEQPKERLPARIEWLAVRDGIDGKELGCVVVDVEWSLPKGADPVSGSQLLLFKSEGDVLTSPQEVQSAYASGKARRLDVAFGGSALHYADPHAPTGRVLHYYAWIEQGVGAEAFTKKTHYVANPAAEPPPPEPTVRDELRAKWGAHLNNMKTADGVYEEVAKIRSERPLSPQEEKYLLALAAEVLRTRK